MSVYNNDVANMSERSLKLLCRLCSRLCRTGFQHMDDVMSGLVAINLNDSQSSCSSRGSRRSMAGLGKDVIGSGGGGSTRRIALSSGLLVELLTGLYFAMLVVCEQYM